MSNKPKRRWYQFSLRILLAAVTLTAIGLAWWKHRSICLEQVRVHAQRNHAWASELIEERKEDREKDGSITDWDQYCVTNTYSNWHGENYSFTLQSVHANNGCHIFTLTLHSGRLTDGQQRLHRELVHEAQLTEQYLHAIWRPWEGLWIDDAPRRVIWKNGFVENVLPEEEPVLIQTPSGQSGDDAFSNKDSVVKAKVANSSAPAPNPSKP